MQKRHTDRKQYFKEQEVTTNKYVIPYINKVHPIKKETRVLEIGCGEGGNLVPFIKMGCEVTGVDIDKNQIHNAQEFIKGIPHRAKVQLLNDNVYNVSVAQIGTFDLILLRDVIEHIPNQNKFLQYVAPFLKPNGKIFFGFPPWYMPFGGHQQMCRNGILSKLPYFHLLPNILYKLILRMGGEGKGTIEGLLEIKATGISISRFQRIVQRNHYQFVRKTLYLINPNYETKFGLRPKRQYRIITSIPYLREILTTCCYCVIKKIDQDLAL